MRLAGGSRLAFGDQGTGVCCVLVHGFGEGRYVWTDVVRAWPGRAISVDLPGHGDSDWRVDGSYTADGQAAAVAEFLRLQRPGPFVLVGHSMGADVAIRAAARRPAGLAGVILIDHDPHPIEAARRLVASEFEEAETGFPNVAAYADWLAARRPMADRTTVNRIAPLAVRPNGHGAFIVKRDPALLAARSRATAATPLVDLLSMQAVPILIVRGQISSFLLRDAACALADRAVRGEVATVARAGHAVMLDNPQGLVEVLTAFVAAAVTSRQRTA